MHTIEEVKDELKDVHQQVEDLSSSTMLLAMETNIISGTIRNIEEFLSDGIIQVILSVTFEAEKVLGTILPQCKH